VILLSAARHPTLIQPLTCFLVLILVLVGLHKQVGIVSRPSSVQGAFRTSLEP